MGFGPPSPHMTSQGGSHVAEPPRGPAEPRLRAGRRGMFGLAGRALPGAQRLGGRARGDLHRGRPRGPRARAAMALRMAEVRGSARPRPSWPPRRRRPASPTWPSRSPRRSPTSRTTSTTSTWARTRTSTICSPRSTARTPSARVPRLSGRTMADEKLVQRLQRGRDPLSRHDDRRGARSSGLKLALACALLEKESSGGQNVFGHDPNTIFAGAGEVTKEKYLEYRRRRIAAGNRTMQGVGPCQLTWWELQDEADREGGCWKPDVNMRVGFRRLATLINAHGPPTARAATTGRATRPWRTARTCSPGRRPGTRASTGSPCPATPRLLRRGEPRAGPSSGSRGGSPTCAAAGRPTVPARRRHALRRGRRGRGAGVPARPRPGRRRRRRGADRARAQPRRPPGAGAARRAGSDQAGVAAAAEGGAGAAARARRAPRAPRRGDRPGVDGGRDLRPAPRAPARPGPRAAGAFAAGGSPRASRS